MTIHECGNTDGPTVLLLHPAVTRWDIFDPLLSFLQADCHLFIPAIPGYDPETTDDFSTVEAVADELIISLRKKGIDHVDLAYGCSMGGAILIRILGLNKIEVDKAIVDGGIAPYPYPKLVCYLIAIRDFLMISLGKLGGIRLLRRTYDGGPYPIELVEYIAEVLEQISYKTIWNTFYHCDNYGMPDGTVAHSLQYYYGEKEAKARQTDIGYVRKKFPSLELIQMAGMEHAELLTVHPECLADLLKDLLFE